MVYIYIGTSDYESEYQFYKNALSVEKIWEDENFGGKVAAIDLCGVPYLIFTDHTKAPGKRLIFKLENGETTSKILI